MQREWLEESFEVIASSDPRNGAIPLSIEGDRFEVLFDEPLGIPKGAIDPTVQCMGANIWWTIPNIIGRGVEQNNLFGFQYARRNFSQGTVRIGPELANDRFDFSFPTAVTAAYQQIPAGNYTLAQLNAVIVNIIASTAQPPATPASLLPLVTAWFRMEQQPITGETLVYIDTRGPGFPNTGNPGYVRFGRTVEPPYNFGPTIVLGWPASAVPLTFAGVANTRQDYASPNPSQFVQNIGAQGIAVPPGLYNVDQLLAQIKLEMVTYGLTETEADAFIAFTGDEARQLTIVTLTSPLPDGVYSFTFGVNGANGFERLLGFTNWPPPGTDKTLRGVYPEISFTGTSVASFNTLNYLLLHTDLVPRGIRFNGDFAQIVAQVSVNVNTGNQIVYEPQNPPICDGANLVGAQRTKATFWITNDVNRPIDTFGEYWSIRLLIKYRISKGL
jgi:hypothetical protein